MVGSFCTKTYRIDSILDAAERNRCRGEGCGRANKEGGKGGGKLHLAVALSCRRME